MLLQGLLEALEALGVCRHGSDVFLEHELLGRGRTDHLTEPPQGGQAPGGPAHIADILAQENRFEAKRGGLEITEGICTRPTQIPDRLVLDRRDVAGGELA